MASPSTPCSWEGDSKKKKKGEHMEIGDAIWSKTTVVFPLWFLRCIQDLLDFAALEK
jgi:hypothetical protein